MKVVINIPKDFEGDYIVDKFKDFFSRVIADIDCKGMCGRYEKEIAEMFLKTFDDSEEKISCNCQRNSNSRDNEPCCGCDSKVSENDNTKKQSYISGNYRKDDRQQAVLRNQVQKSWRRLLPCRLQFIQY